MTAIGTSFDEGRQGSTGGVEWALLLMGLPGLVVIALPLSSHLSPWSAIANTFVFSTGRDWIQDVVWLCMHVPFFIPPLVSLAQLMRCLDRQPDRAVNRGLLVVAYLHLLAIPAVCVAEFLDLVMGRYDLTEPGHLSSVRLLVRTVINLALVRRMVDRRQPEAYECLAMGVYVSVFLMWGAGLHDVMGVGGVAMAWTSGVYGVSYWRRFNGTAQIP